MGWTETIRTLGRGPVDRGPEFRVVPEIVRLDVQSGVAASSKPPVRIYLGTEDAQHRAERVFVYSVAKHRSPDRVYEIHLMKNLRGFSRRGWRTSFTNYRFAIPDFAGRQGRAIYNDVDQIYLSDPAELHDLELGSHGFLAVSAEDTSVMLLDCERMAKWWNLETAKAGSKSKLLAGPASTPGLWGQLDGGWNARDLAEYDPQSTKCLHFTALHTQPWQPTPEAYSYHDHPLGDLWLSLEEEADARGFQIFTSDHPSARYREIAAQGHGPTAATQTLEHSAPASTPTREALQMVGAEGAKSALLCSFAAASDDVDALVDGASVTRVQLHDETSWPHGSFELVAAHDLLERVPADDVPWLLDELFAHAQRCVYVGVSCSHSTRVLADGGNERACIRPPEWWRAQVAAAARRHPGVRWHLDAFEAFGRPQSRVTSFQAEPVSRERAPRVWVLFGNKGGDNAQLANLARALGWPYEVKQLAFNGLHVVPSIALGASLASLDRETARSLEAPWPDVVIAAGKRSVPVARWIQERSEGRARLIHLGRPWAPLDWFDLIVTTPQYRLPARPNVLHNTLPLNGADPGRLARAAIEPRWRDEIDALPGPRIALLVGGNSSTHLLTAAAATELGEQASALAAKAGGSLLVTTSPRTPPEATDALEAAIATPCLFHRWRQGAGNPYEAFLALADGFIVTGDSASMAAEACSAGKPVTIFPVPHRSPLVAGVAETLGRLSPGKGARTTYRGTPKQQDGIARLYDRLVDLGLFTPARDLSAYHDALEARGLARRAGSTTAAALRPRTSDLARTVTRVRRLVDSERPVG